MRSYKELLVSALLSATVCQSGVSALSTGGKIGVGVGTTSAFVIVTALCFKNCKSGVCVVDANMKNATEKKIRELICNDRYNILKNLDIKKAKSMTVTVGDNSCELDNNEKIGCLVKGEGQYASEMELINGFKCGEIIDTINNCLKPVTQGLQNVNSICISDTGGSRFQGFKYAVGEDRYSVSVEASLSAVRFECRYGTNNKGCLIELKLRG